VKGIKYKREFIKRKTHHSGFVRYYFRGGNGQEDIYKWSKWKNRWRRRWAGRPTTINIKLGTNEWRKVTQLEILIILGAKAAEGPLELRKKSGRTNDEQIKE
jgi:hypothetical protein